MSKKLLITFGCSWTYGIGAAFEHGMSQEDYKSIAWDQDLCNCYSFRGLLSKQLGYDNINLSNGGSSNARQFRLAKSFFNSQQFKQAKQIYDRIVVLWGITSTARTEMFDLSTQRLENFFYTRRSALEQSIVKYSYNHDHEVFVLATEMIHWNQYFNCLGIENFWFDTFNHHDYNTPSPDLIHHANEYKQAAGPDWPSWEQYQQKQFESNDFVFNEITDLVRYEFAKLINVPDVDRLIYKDLDPRDLMSQMAIRKNISNIDNKYHESDWKIDTNRAEFLVDQKLLNPISHHPTQTGHVMLAEMLQEAIPL